MPKKSFFENELNSVWREAREKGIEYGIALGHKDGTQENDRKGMLYVACEMQDLNSAATAPADSGAPPDVTKRAVPSRCCRPRRGSASSRLRSSRAAQIGAFSLNLR